MVDLCKLVPRVEHSHGLSDSDFESLFTKDKPIIFNFHGYPWLIHKLTYRRRNQSNIHVRGYKEQGNINTPLELAIRNQIDRFNLAIDVIDRVPKLEVSGALSQRMVEKSNYRKPQLCTRIGIDKPESTDWKRPFEILCFLNKFADAFRPCRFRRPSRRRVLVSPASRGMDRTGEAPISSVLIGDASNKCGSFRSPHPTKASDRATPNLRNRILTELPSSEPLRLRWDSVSSPELVYYFWSSNGKEHGGMKMNRSALIIASVAALLVVSAFSYGTLWLAAQSLAGTVGGAGVGCQVQYRSSVLRHSLTGGAAS